MSYNQGFPGQHPSGQQNGYPNYQAPTRPSMPPSQLNGFSSASYPQAPQMPGMPPGAMPSGPTPQIARPGIPPAVPQNHGIPQSQSLPPMQGYHPQPPMSRPSLQPPTMPGMPPKPIAQAPPGGNIMPPLPHMSNGAPQMNPYTTPASGYEPTPLSTQPRPPPPTAIRQQPHAAPQINGYPTQQSPQMHNNLQPPQINPGLNQQFGNMNFGGHQQTEPEPINLLDSRRPILAADGKYYPPEVRYQTQPPPGIQRIPPNRKNCDRDVMSCTLQAIPSSDALCQKAKLPFGLLLHPYKDLLTLPVITTSNIVRCRSCRAYINPFVSFIDMNRWKCNLCSRINEVPEEFKSNPVTKEYGKPEERPECVNSTVEFIAPSEYMSRPPQAAQYLFIIDVSYNAVQSGYLEILAEELLQEYQNMPGDRRTKIGFLCYDSSLHFFNLSDELAQPQLLSVSDIDDPFEPMPDSILVNRQESSSQIEQFLKMLPNLFKTTVSPSSCGGSAITVGQKMLSKNGGRISLFSTTRISEGLGKLEERTPKDGECLNGVTDFYKTLAIEANQHHIAIDLFLFGHQFQDIASLAPVARNSAGQVYRYPGLHIESNPVQSERFRSDFHRYLVRKIGFESVMRVRATRGISIHTFFGNFFVRSTDLLNLACISPDSGYAMRLQIDEDLKGYDYVGFQCALLYTSTKGDRRIRVHTMSFPVTSQLSEVYSNADAQLVTSMLAHFAVERSLTHTVNDAREALLHAASDALSNYKACLPAYQKRDPSAILVPKSLGPFPLYLSALLKSDAFRLDNRNLDNKAFLMSDIKQSPMKYSKFHWHPEIYRIDNIVESLKAKNLYNSDEVPETPEVDSLPLTAEILNKECVFLMDCGWKLLLFISVHAPQEFFRDVIDASYGQLVDGGLYEIPEEPEDENCSEPESRTYVRNFINSLQDDRSHGAPIQIIRADGNLKENAILRKLIRDRTGSQKPHETGDDSYKQSYYEFLQYLQKNMK